MEQKKEFAEFAIELFANKPIPNPLTLVRHAGEKCRAAYDYIQVEDKAGARMLLIQAKFDIDEALAALK
jgi:hypothetical protein